MIRQPGLYQLLICLPQSTRIAIGKLGAFDFPAGYYIYTGSAMGGLEQRLARYLSRPKRLHWHIDYLIEHARLEAVMKERTAERRECSLNARAAALPGGQVLVRGFGSSDCRCEAHLVYIGQAVPPAAIPWFASSPI